jgi:hypothetical protein
MRIPRAALLTAGLVFAVATFATVATTASASSATAHPSSTITLKMARAYKPKASFGGTDDYHCTLVNPHVTENSYVISSEFFPGSAEDHHAIFFLVPPSLAATAERDNTANGGNGWTCFGEAPLPNTGLAQISNTPWLAAWAPGAGLVRLPKDTGIRLPAGSLVVMQVHYNLLVGDKPVKNKLVLHTVPMTTPLLPLKLDLMPAPPDVPCPTGVTGPLCNRAASLANEGKVFGQSEVGFVNTLESICGRNPANPPEGDSTSCMWPVYQSGYIVMAGAHMHLTGVSLTMVLNPGTPQAKTILDVPAFNFHNQKAYNLKTPVAVAAGDKIQVTCTYDPRLAQELPLLRKVAPHFILWGDGSSDEMCLGLTWTSKTLPNANYPV